MEDRLAAKVIPEKLYGNRLYYNKFLPLDGGGYGGGVKEMKKEVQHIAKILRKRPTEAEKTMWRHLRGKQLEGFKFRRQEPIGNYVADFVCYEKRIIVEVDGGQGFKVLRFRNNEVSKNTEGVWAVIRNHCLSHPPLTPPIKGLSCSTFFTGHEGTNKVIYPHENMWERAIG